MKTKTFTATGSFLLLRKKGTLKTEFGYDALEEWVDVNAFIYKAINHNRMQNYSNAIFDLQTCLKYNPNSADAYFHLAVSYFNLGQKEKAIEAIRKARGLFKQGYFMQVSYVETFEQLYLSDIEEIETKLVQ